MFRKHVQITNEGKLWFHIQIYDYARTHAWATHARTHAWSYSARTHARTHAWSYSARTHAWATHARMSHARTHGVTPHARTHAWATHARTHEPRTHARSYSARTHARMSHARTHAWATQAQDVARFILPYKFVYIVPKFHSAIMAHRVHVFSRELNAINDVKHDKQKCNRIIDEGGMELVIVFATAFTIYCRAIFLLAKRKRRYSKDIKNVWESW